VLQPNGSESKKISDFGTMVTVHRTNSESATESDLSLVEKTAKELVAPFDDRINDFAAFNLSFGGSSTGGGSEGILVILTEYWLGDDEGNEGLEDEVLIERDRPLAERFGELLQKKLGAEFEVEVYCGHW
jgi:hypothetical protein